MKATTRSRPAFRLLNKRGLAVKPWPSAIIPFVASIVTSLFFLVMVILWDFPGQLALAIVIPLDVVFLGQAFRELVERRKSRLELGSNLVLLPVELVKQMMTADANLANLASEETYPIPIWTENGKEDTLHIGKGPLLSAFDDEVWRMLIGKGCVGMLDPALVRDLHRFYFELGEASDAIERRNSTLLSLSPDDIKSPEAGKVIGLNLRYTTDFLEEKLPEIRRIGIVLAYALQQPLKYLGVKQLGYAIIGRLAIGGGEEVTPPTAPVIHELGEDALDYWYNWLMDRMRSIKGAMAAWENKGILFCAVMEQTNDHADVICQIVAPRGTYEWGPEEDDVIHGLRFLSSLTRMEPGKVPRIIESRFPFSDDELSENIYLTPRSAYDII